MINADLLFSNILGEFATEVDISGECEKQENVAVIDIGNFELNHTNNGEFIFIKIILKLSEYEMSVVNFYHIYTVNVRSVRTFLKFFVVFLSNR